MPTTTSSYPTDLDTFAPITAGPSGTRMNDASEPASAIITHLQAAVAAIQEVVGKGDGSTAGSVIEQLSDLADAISGLGGSATVNRSITAQFDGGTTDGNINNIEVGDEVIIRSPYAITLSDWTLLLSDATGNVSIDVQTKPFSSGSFASITSSGTPSAVSGANAEGTVSGWSSSSITSGHLIKLVVTARSGVVPRATLQLNGVQA